MCVAVVGRQQQQTTTQKIRNVCITETGTALQLEILEVQINLNYQTTKGDNRKEDGARHPVHLSQLCVVAFVPARCTVHFLPLAYTVAR